MSDDLSWKGNTEAITKRAFTRMIILRNLFQFEVPLEDLLEIYILYIRSVVEQSAVVWSSSISKGEQKDIERVQKVALRIIFKDNYSSYTEALKLSGLESLSARRGKLCLNFAKKCTKSEQTSQMFPINIPAVDTRNPETFYVTPARTERFLKCKDL